MQGGVLGLHHCPTCHQGMGDTRALFLHMQEGGGRCLLAMGLSLDQFKRQIRLRQMKLRDKRQVSPGWGNKGCHMCYGR